MKIYIDLKGLTGLRQQQDLAPFSGNDITEKGIVYVDQKTNSTRKRMLISNDPRAEFLAGAFAEIRRILLHDSAQPSPHGIRISVHLEAGDDEVYYNWRRSFSRA